MREPALDLEEDPATSSFGCAVASWDELLGPAVLEWVSGCAEELDGKSSLIVSPSASGKMEYRSA